MGYRHFFIFVLIASIPSVIAAWKAPFPNPKDVDDEDPDEVLSDDVIVERLRKIDVLVARRTVAKYRDSLRIPSSVERRKIKMASARVPVRRHNSLPVEA